MGVQVTFLGAGDAFNASGRCHASYLISTDSARVLLDCGATTLYALKRMGLDGNAIDAVCISHLHGDHFAGLPFLLLECVFETPRQRPLILVGPPGTGQRVNDLYHVVYKELAARGLPFELRCIEVLPQQRTQLGPVDLLPFRVPHQEQHISLGFRVTVDGKTILYSGDTGWTEDLITQSQGTDLFICECCYWETKVCFHLDYERIAANRERFGCKRLILTHIGREVMAHRAEVTIEMAHDGMVVEL